MAPKAAGRTVARRDRVDLREPTIRAAFLRRIRNWAKDVAGSVPEHVLADALASPTMRGTLATVFAQGHEAEPSSTEALLEEALSRGAAAKAALRERAGGLKPTGWVASHLGISRQAVDKRRRSGKLLAVESPDGTFAYPLCQFASDGVVRGLEEVLQALAVEDSWERLAALVNPSPALSGRSVVDVLSTSSRNDERARAVAVAREFLL